ncbi:MAG TPA: TetR/AcrR family transcriptional regulator [Acidimicrobiia bacterium]|jgi:AcrR family transcriptional regulator|nr:TetR/AcrR family transcriptional regulator [Acidimicrobiia bacterium]
MRLPADQRRLQLLEVARDRFAQKGFNATSMDEIAEAAGVTKPVLYQHFPSKRALYVELLEDTGRQLLTSLADATGRAGSGRERVELGFRAYFNFAVNNRSSFRLLLGTTIRSDPEFARIVEEIINAAAETVSTLIEIDATDEQRLVLANALVGMGEGVSRRALQDDGPTLDADQLASWIAELAWFGLRGVRA